MNTPNRIGYTLHGNRYLHITSRRTLHHTFCSKLNGLWAVWADTLRGDQEPSVAEMLAAVGNPQDYREVVFCGLGEPMLRLYPLLEAAARLRSRGAYVRVHTDGLANLVYGRDVTPDLENNIDALSIALNAQDEATYTWHCRPKVAGAYAALLDFAERARDFVPDVTLTAIDGLAGVDIAACARIAQDLGVKFCRCALDEVG